MLPADVLVNASPRVRHDRTVYVSRHPLQLLLVEVLQRPIESTQFVSLAFGQSARDAGIAVSMGSRGDCYDNAVAESFFATLKKELIRRRSWPDRRELIGEVFEYIEAFYNPVRRHSTLGYLSPIQFEEHRPTHMRQTSTAPNTT